MKTIPTQKETNYSLHNIANYNTELPNDLAKVTQKYSELLIEYLKFILENIKTKNNNLIRFIITRGSETITNVFLNILFYTKNIDITYYHCQKSFYYYVEFVGQISEDEKMFLQLTSRDATIYVYKKTIFEINNDLKKISETSSKDTHDKMIIINSFVSVYKMFIQKIIDNNNEKTNEIYINHFQKISDKLNSLINKNKIKIFEDVLDKLYCIENIESFFNINNLLVKKFVKKSDLFDDCELKLDKITLLEKSEDTPEKFVIWLLE